MSYRYRAYTTDKQIVRGTIEVASESLAEAALYRAGYRNVLSLEEIKPGLDLEKLLPSLYGIKAQEVIDFSTQLATLVESGISLVTSLELLGGKKTRKPLKQIIAGLVEEIQGGGSLSGALDRYPRAFSDTYCQVVKASEQAGRLDTGLRQAAAHLEKQAAAAAKIRRAMMYPAFVLLMALAVSVLLITVALPPLINLFNSLGAGLPWMTSLLINVSSFFLHNGLYVLAVVLLLVLLVIALTRLASVKMFYDRFLVKMPVTGAITVERSMEYFCRTTAMLLQAGLRFPAIMDIVIQANRNRVIRAALAAVRDGLIRGEGLSRPMSASPLFPPLLVEMVIVGERSGAMDATLLTLADFYEKKISRRIDVLISMIEPALTVIVGLVVIFIALSMITPLYTILRSMR